MKYIVYLFIIIVICVGVIDYGVVFCVIVNLCRVCLLVIIIIWNVFY